jgi:hypothetical protein
MSPQSAVGNFILFTVYVSNWMVSFKINRFLLQLACYAQIWASYSSYLGELDSSTYSYFSIASFSVNIYVAGQLFWFASMAVSLSSQA